MNSMKPHFDGVENAAENVVPITLPDIWYSDIYQFPWIIFNSVDMSGAIILRKSCFQLVSYFDD